ncbi:MAG: tetratricopeptide repeat protein, partial [Chloroflexi bacterium]|nr:tetratricopeptide repeat protein [Chloroflexota bacterium]
MTTSADPRLLAGAAELLARRAGFRFNLEQPNALANALSNRIHALHLSNDQAYLAHLHNDETEWLKLAEELTVHETAFFRHAGQFRVLSEVILPELVRLRAPERTLRLWSAACATGEEAYSLAIAIRRLGLPADWQVEILATDLSTRALDVARQGVFDKRRLRTLSSEQIALYFDPCGERFQLHSDLRSMVRFAQFNLTQASPVPDEFRRMDLVFCENVLIYFSPEAIRRCVTHLRDVLREGGYLFLGYSETLYGMSEGFLTISFNDAYVYRREMTPLAEPLKARPALPPRAPQTATLLPVRPRPSAPAPAPALASVVAQRPAVTSPSLSSVEALIDGGDLAGAIRLTEKWLALEPESKPARFTLARLYAAKDLDVEAADLLRRLLRVDPLHAPSYLLLGILCYRQGEIEEALAQFQHALYLEPKTAVAYFYLGNIYQQRGQLPHAIHAYRNAIRAAADIVLTWDSSFTPEVLIQVCERNIA